MSDQDNDNSFDLLLEINEKAVHHQLTNLGTKEHKQTNTYLSFSVCNESLLIPISEISELVSPPDIVEIPRMHPWMRGIANIRGSLLSLTDLESFFCHKRQVVTVSSRVLVIERDSSRYGLLVPEVFGIKEIIPDMLTPAVNQTGPAPLNGYVDEHVKTGGQLWKILNMDHLIADKRFLYVAA